DTAFETILAAERDAVPSVSALRSEVPKEIDAIVAKAVARAPEARYQTAAAMQMDLDRALAKMKLPASLAQLASWLEALFAGTDQQAEEPRTDRALEAIAEADPE